MLIHIAGNYLTNTVKRRHLTMLFQEMLYICPYTIRILI